MFIFVLAVSFAYAQNKMEQRLNKKTNLIEAKYYHDNGLVSQEGTFNLEGKLHGEWTSFDENGSKIAMGTYSNGLKSGTWYFWSGDKMKEVEYNDNSIASVDGVKNSKTLVVKD